MGMMTQLKITRPMDPMPALCQVSRHVIEYYGYHEHDSGSSKTYNADVPCAMLF